MIRARLGRLALVAAAAAAALVPLPPELVERWYSTAAYPPLQRAATSLSNLVPFALLDALIVAVAVGWLALAARDLGPAARRRRGGFLRAAAGVLGRTAVWAAALYVVFLVVWGLNYRRTPLVEKLRFDASRVTPAAARALTAASVERLNVLYAAAHRTGWPGAHEIDETLARALARADRELGGTGAVVAGRPKASGLDWFFRRTATDGMTDPYFLETLISTALLPFERPFVVAHEWSHLAGVADEGDANFLAWLACVQAPSPAAQYSGWLMLYSEAAASLDPNVRAQVALALGSGPRADLTAIRARVLRQISPTLAAAGRLVYDRYLKANRVEAGVRSYGRVVELVLGSQVGQVVVGR